MLRLSGTHLPARFARQRTPGRYRRGSLSGGSIGAFQPVQKAAVCDQDTKSTSDSVRLPRPPAIIPKFSFFVFLALFSVSVIATSAGGESDADVGAPA